MDPRHPNLDAPTHPSGQEPGWSPGRIEALADGVFAIVMTILVFDFKVPSVKPGAGEAEFFDELSKIWPVAVCFFMSFVSVATLWIGYRAQFHFIRRVDRPLQWIGLFFMMFVTLIPFLTRLMAAFPAYWLPDLLYGVNIMLAGLMLQWHWIYATTHAWIAGSHLTNEIRWAVVRRIGWGQVMYLAAVGLAPFSPWGSVGIYIAVPLLYLLPGRVDRHVVPRHH